MRASLAFLAFGALALSAPVIAQSVVTPKPGTPLRKAVLDGLRSDPNGKFTVQVIRVGQSPKVALAYVDADDGLIGNSVNLLRRSRAGKWVVFWGEGDGGSNACGDAVRHYHWAVAEIKRAGLNPKTFAPEILKQLADYQNETAQSGAEIHCAGDFTGGPTK